MDPINFAVHDPNFHLQRVVVRCMDPDGVFCGESDMWIILWSIGPLLRGYNFRWNYLMYLAESRHGDDPPMMTFSGFLKSLVMI